MIRPTTPSVLWTRAAQGALLALLVPAAWLAAAALGLSEAPRDAWWLPIFVLGSAISSAAFGAWLGRSEDRLRARAEELDRLSVTDPLTGLKNVRYFWGRMTEAYAIAERERRPLSVLLVDADDFKAINDRHGHPTGDQVLVRLARAIAGVARAGDTVARVGGEEFALILPSCDGPGALQVAERIVAEARRAEVEVGGVRVAATVSVGLASTSTLGFIGQHALYERADLALFDAKARGKDRVRSAEPSAPPARVSASSSTVGWLG